MPASPGVSSSALGLFCILMLVGSRLLGDPDTFWQPRRRSPDPRYGSAALGRTPSPTPSPGSLDRQGMARPGCCWRHPMGRAVERRRRARRRHDRAHLRPHGRVAARPACGPPAALIAALLILSARGKPHAGPPPHLRVPDHRRLDDRARGGGRDARPPWWLALLMAAWAQSPRELFRSAG